MISELEAFTYTSKAAVVGHAVTQVTAMLHLHQWWNDTFSDVIEVMGWETGPILPRVF